MNPETMTADEIEAFVTRLRVALETGGELTKSEEQLLSLALRLAKVLRENERLRDKLDAIAEADDTGIVTVDDLKRWASEALEAQP